MMTRILVAIDLSEPSDEALRQGYERAQRAGATMAVCHVLPDLGWVQSLLPAANPLGPDQAREGEALSTEAIRQRLARVIPQAKPEIFVERGRDYAHIVQRAEAWNADLIVVGSRGATGLTRLLLGSVAERVVRHSHCNVLVARPISSRGGVVAATDLSDPSMPAITAAAEEARRLGARLSVVHALDFTSAGILAAVGGPFGVGPVMPSRETILAVRGAVERSLQDALASLTVDGESLVLEGSPAAAIAQQATTMGAELVVVGTHGRTGLARNALGSVAARAIRMAPCSVLVVRFAPGARHESGD